jgi:hypothetical protein
MNFDMNKAIYGEVLKDASSNDKQKKEEPIKEEDTQNETPEFFKNFIEKIKKSTTLTLPVKKTILSVILKQKEKVEKKNEKKRKL